MERDHGHPERDRRIPIRYPAVLTTADGREHKVQVIDISAYGCRIEGQPGLSPGDHVYLNVGKEGNVPAEIRWVDGTCAGASLA